jgi:hypothetical protein
MAHELRRRAFRTAGWLPSAKISQTGSFKQPIEGGKWPNFYMKDIIWGRLYQKWAKRQVYDQKRRFEGNPIKWQYFSKTTLSAGNEAGDYREWAELFIWKLRVFVPPDRRQSRSSGLARARLTCAAGAFVALKSSTSLGP